MKNADHTLCTFNASVQNKSPCELLNDLTVRSTDYTLYTYKASSQKQFACDLLIDLTVGSTNLLYRWID